jgi:hypothetical protein
MHYMIRYAAGGVIQTMCFHASFHKTDALLADDSISSVKDLCDLLKEPVVVTQVNDLLFKPHKPRGITSVEIERRKVFPYCWINLE